MKLGDLQSSYVNTTEIIAKICLGWLNSFKKALIKQSVNKEQRLVTLVKNQLEA